MDEKTLINGKFSKTNLLSIIAGIIAILTLCYSIWWWQRVRAWDLSRGYDMTLSKAIDNGYFAPFIFGGIPMLILAVVFYFWMSRCKLTVTNKRVYGVAAFGKRVDLPIDMISATASGALNSITVATSSGKISFWLITNRNEVLNTISDQLIKRQAAHSTTTIKQEIPQSNADELKKYKDLLDSGVISQEEFDAKKKQLLKL